MKYAICTDNSDHPVSLKKWKVYRLLSIDPKDPLHREGYLRVIDEEEEPYYYPEACFMPLQLPDEVARRYEQETAA